MVGERMTGTVAWGQWRGWYPGLDAGKLGGLMGNGIMMNTQLRYLNNRFIEGNKIVRWDAGGTVCSFCECNNDTG